MSRTALQHGIMDSVPDSVYAAFESEPHLTMPKLAKVLRMDLKTIGKHREAGNLPVHIKGTGLERRHYVCTLGDVIEFYRRTGEACQSSKSENRPITSSISRSKVIAFTVPPKKSLNVRLRKSRRPSAPKPSGSLNRSSPQGENP